MRSPDWSVVAGCLYAFSGFTVYNIFFNHFLDVVALFPYMLAALDDAVLDGKRGPFPFWVALNLVNNYFFFAGQAVFLILYFLCMLACRVYKIGPRSFAALAGETLLGCAMGCVLLLPADFRCSRIPAPSTPTTGTGILSTATPSSTGPFFTAASSCPTPPISRICSRTVSSNTPA